MRNASTVRILGGTAVIGLAITGAVIASIDPLTLLFFSSYMAVGAFLAVRRPTNVIGWLLIAMHKFTRMPFFAAVKEAKLRTFVTPGQVLAVSAKLVHDGSGFAVTKAEIKCEGKPVCNAELTFRLVEFPNPSFRASMENIAAEIAFPMEVLAHG